MPFWTERFSSWRAGLNTTPAYAYSPQPVTPGFHSGILPVCISGRRPNICCWAHTTPFGRHCVTDLNRQLSPSVTTNAVRGLLAFPFHALNNLAYRFCFLLLFPPLPGRHARVLPTFPNAFACWINTISPPPPPTLPCARLRFLYLPGARACGYCQLAFCYTRRLPSGGLPSRRYRRHTCLRCFTTHRSRPTAPTTPAFPGRTRTHHTLPAIQCPFTAPQAARLRRWHFAAWHARPARLPARRFCRATPPCLPLPPLRAATPCPPYRRYHAPPFPSTLPPPHR